MYCWKWGGGKPYNIIRNIIITEEESNHDSGTVYKTDRPEHMQQQWLEIGNKLSRSTEIDAALKGHHTGYIINTISLQIKKEKYNISDIIWHNTPIRISEIGLVL